MLGIRQIHTKRHRQLNHTTSQEHRTFTLSHHNHTFTHHDRYQGLPASTVNGESSRSARQRPLRQAKKSERNSTITTPQSDKEYLEAEAVAAASAASALLLAAKAKLESVGRNVGNHILVVLLSRKVGLEDADGLLVDFLVGVIVEGLELLNATKLLNLRGILVHLGLARVAVADTEKVVEGLEGNEHDAGLRRLEEVEQRFNEALVDHVADLFRRATRSGVGQGPRSLLLDVEVARLEELNKAGDDACLDDGLDLRAVAGSDVGDGPAGLLADALLARGEESEEAREDGDIDDNLSLDVVASDHVTNGAEGGRLDGEALVEEELDHAAGNTVLNHSLDALVGAVGHV